MLSEHSYTNFSPSTIKKSYRFHKKCSVPKCHNGSYSKKRSNISLHELRVEWAEILHLENMPKATYICSDHFTAKDFVTSTKGLGLRRKLKKTAAPSQNLPRSESIRQSCDQKDKILPSIQTDCEITNENLPDAEIADRKIRNEDESRSNGSIPKMAAFKRNSSTSTDQDAGFNGCENVVIECDPNELISNEAISTVTVLKNEESVGTEAESSKATPESESSKATQTEAELRTISPRSTVWDMLLSDAHVQEFTGLKNIVALRRLCDTFVLLEKSKREAKDTELKLEDRILLTLMKLKLNFPFDALSAFFYITETAAATYFDKTVRLMYKFLKRLIPWPSREQIKNLPETFDNVPDARVKIDCIELPVTCCSCDACSVRCYSHNERTHTLKVQVSTSPGRIITHISPIYGGRTSNKFIFANGGLLDKLESGDCVLANRGFFIQPECEERGIKLIQSPSLKNLRLNAPEEVDTDIVQADEQGIQRLEAFKILTDTIPWSVVPCFDEIFGVICGLTNLSNPIFVNRKF